jgi:cysteine desulfurase/selenocysteine lyase
MSIELTRKDFPLLAEGGKEKIIYFDNACQSLRPQSVISAITNYYEKYPACGGRSMHRLAREVTKKCDESREIVAKFLGAKKKEEIIFTKNTTEGINLVASSLDFVQGDVVLTSDKEHNSNLIPWQWLKKQRGIVHKIAPSLSDNTFDMDRFEKALEEGVKLVSMCFTSNLDGVSIPVKGIIEKAHRYNTLVLLDAAQTVPHMPVDVSDLDVDFLVFSGHKALGPSGTGVLFGKYHLLEKLAPFLVGGDTVSKSTYETHEFLAPPERFEAGLQNYAGIIGLGEGLNYLKQVGMEAIKKQETALNKYVTEQLTETAGLKIIGPIDSSLRGGIVSFYVENKDHHQIALMLDEMSGVMVRSGQHCVHSWFNAHQISGSVRTSMYFYNTIEEAEVFVESLKKVLKVL